eukprot:786857-Rhodomonas_salina.4
MDSGVRLLCHIAVLMFQESSEQHNPHNRNQTLHSSSVTSMMPCPRLEHSAKGRAASKQRREERGGSAIVTQGRGAGFQCSRGRSCTSTRRRTKGAWAA